MKLSPQQLIGANQAPHRTRQDSLAGESVVAIEAVSKSHTSYGQSYGSRTLPEVYASKQSHATDFYRYTESLEADSGELIGVDTYA